MNVLSDFSKGRTQLLRSINVITNQFIHYYERRDDFLRITKAKYISQSPKTSILE